jgi:hypothetical protein
MMLSIYTYIYVQSHNTIIYVYVLIIPWKLSIFRYERSLLQSVDVAANKILLSAVHMF